MCLWFLAPRQMPVDGRSEIAETGNAIATKRRFCLIAHGELVMQERELVERVKALMPMVAEHAAQAERERKPVDSVMTALEETGVYKFFVPKRYGGSVWKPSWISGCCWVRRVCLPPG